MVLGIRKEYSIIKDESKIPSINSQNKQVASERPVEIERLHGRAIQLWG